MNGDALLDRLETYPDRLSALLRGLSIEDARWRPKERQWSILEIVNHLADEEVEDFPLRLRMTLEDPTQDWPPIDPEGAAKERAYNERDLHETLQRFITFREKSISYFRSLEAPDWSTTHTHPKFGSMSAGDLLAAWAAHDLLHTRQIIKRLFQFVVRDSEGYDTDYAGTWVA